MSRVLIVDDTASNREVLTDALADEGHHLDEASDGDEAIGRVLAEPPDVILLDVMMPNLDGFECCRRLKADGATACIPIIMITALTDDAQIVRGLDVGATDFISKPFSFPVVRARVRAALRTKSAIDQLEHRNQEILYLAYAMTHDLQTPLASVSGAAQMLTSHLAADTDPKVQKWIERIQNNAGRMVDMLEDLMTYAKAGREQIELDKVDLVLAVRQAMDLVQGDRGGSSVSLDIDQESVWVRANAKALVRVMANLVGNAVKYSADRPSPWVNIRIESANGLARCTIRDNGSGIPPSQINRVFLPFRRGSAKTPGTGLGLAIVKRFIEGFNGRVWLESDGESGVTAYVELKLAAVDSARRRKGHAA
ncbi:MAG: response regulator [Planctomycetes bacterium]|nr:response regulator [Planctomycetota bacterium]